MANSEQDESRHGELDAIPSLFEVRTDQFPDPRDLKFGSAEYLEQYHRVENWEGVQLWKTQEELDEVKAGFHGKSASGAPVPKKYPWIADLERHYNLVGSPAIVSSTDVQLRNTHDSLARHYKDCIHELGETLIGGNVEDTFKAVYVGIVFGRHTYIEGSSGIGKTAVVRAVCQFLGMPYRQFDAYADASDLALLGGEVPQSSPTGGLRFVFERGPILTPGLISLVIDELPRLPASTSNVLLQAMAERKTSVSLVASGRGIATILLSPAFTVIGTGNPVGYGGQGERSLALFDRFDIGVDMSHPSTIARLQILRAALNPQKREANVLPPQFTLFEARELLDRVVLPDPLKPLLIMASYAISPDDFLQRTKTENPLSSGFASMRTVQAGEKPIWQAADSFMKLNRKPYEELRRLVNDNLVEGSNPRGEISAVKNAQACALLDWNSDLKDPQNPQIRLKPFVTLSSLEQGFVWANMARLKTHPGSEGSRAAILKAASDLFFNKEKWDEALSRSNASADLGLEWGIVMENGS